MKKIISLCVIALVSFGHIVAQDSLYLWDLFNLKSEQAYYGSPKLVMETSKNLLSACEDFANVNGRTVSKGRVTTMDISDFWNSKDSFFVLWKPFKYFTGKVEIHEFACSNVGDKQYVTSYLADYEAKSQADEKSYKKALEAFKKDTAAESKYISSIVPNFNLNVLWDFYGLILDTMPVIPLFKEPGKFYVIKYLDIKSKNPALQNIPMNLFPVFVSSGAAPYYPGPTTPFIAYLPVRDKELSPEAKDFLKNKTIQKYYQKPHNSVSYRTPLRILTFELTCKKKSKYKNWEILLDGKPYKSTYKYAEMKGINWKKTTFNVQLKDLEKRDITFAGYDCVMKIKIAQIPEYTKVFDAKIGTTFTFHFLRDDKIKKPKK